MSNFWLWVISIFCLTISVAGISICFNLHPFQIFLVAAAHNIVYSLAYYLGTLPSLSSLKSKNAKLLKQIEKYKSDQ